MTLFKSNFHTDIEKAYEPFDMAIIKKAGQNFGEKWVANRKQVFASLNEQALRTLLNKAEKNRECLAALCRDEISVDDSQVQTCMANFFQRANTIYGVEPTQYPLLIEIYQNETFVTGLKKYTDSDEFVRFFQEAMTIFCKTIPSQMKMRT